MNDRGKGSRVVARGILGRQENGNGGEGANGTRGA